MLSIIVAILKRIGLPLFGRAAGAPRFKRRYVRRTGGVRVVVCSTVESYT